MKATYRKTTLDLTFLDLSLKSVSNVLKSLHKGYSNQINGEDITVRENGKVFLENNINALFVEGLGCEYLLIYVMGNISIYKINKKTIRFFNKIGLHTLLIYRMFGKCIIDNYNEKEGFKKRRSNSFVLTEEDLLNKRKKYSLTKKEMNLIIKGLKKYEFK